MTTLQPPYKVHVFCKVPVTSFTRMRSNGPAPPNSKEDHVIYSLPCEQLSTSSVEEKKPVCLTILASLVLSMSVWTSCPLHFVNSGYLSPPSEVQLVRTFLPICGLPVWSVDSLLLLLEISEATPLGVSAVAVPANSVRGTVTQEKHLPRVQAAPSIRLWA